VSADPRVIGPDLQLDVSGVVLRIEQIAGLSADSPLRELLIMRLANSDAPRLRRHLTPETLAMMAEFE
jgi:hypothetical protein